MVNCVVWAQTILGPPSSSGVKPGTLYESYSSVQSLDAKKIYFQILQISIPAKKSYTESILAGFFLSVTYFQKQKIEKKSNEFFFYI